MILLLSMLDGEYILKNLSYQDPEKKSFRERIISENDIFTKGDI